MQIAANSVIATMRVIMWFPPWLSRQLPLHSVGNLLQEFIMGVWEALAHVAPAVIFVPHGYSVVAIGHRCDNLGYHGV